MDPWEAIQQSLTTFANLLWPMATALAGVGIATMAILQMVKDIFHLHRRFHRRAIARWLEERAAKAAMLGPEFRAAPAVAQASLIKLATAGDGDAFFSLEAPQLTGQVSAASQIVLDFPSMHQDLYFCLAAEAFPDDVRRIMEPAPALPRANEPEPETTRQARTGWIDARNRVGHQVSRGIDGLLIALQYRWRYLNQSVAFVLNVLFVLVALVVQSYRAGRVPESLPAFIVVAVLGGFVAPIAKDVVTAIQ